MESGSAHVIYGDCFNVLPTLAPESVDWKAGPEEPSTKVRDDPFFSPSGRRPEALRRVETRDKSVEA